MKMLISKVTSSLSLSRFQYKNYHCWIAGITKTGRKIYKRQYPVYLVNPDGSTIHIQYHEPLGIIKLPINIDLLSEEEKQLHLEARKPKSKIVIEEEFEDDFDENQYLKAKNK